MGTHRKLHVPAESPQRPITSTCSEAEAFSDSQTYPVRLCRVYKSWMPATHAKTARAVPPPAASLSPLATRRALETRPFKGSLSWAVFVSRARPRRRQNEHGPDYTGVVSRRARSVLETAWFPSAWTRSAKPGRLHRGGWRLGPHRYGPQGEPAAPGGGGASPWGRRGALLHCAVAPACPGSPCQALSRTRKPGLDRTAEGRWCQRQTSGLLGSGGVRNRLSAVTLFECDLVLFLSPQLPHLRSGGRY